MRLNLKPRNVVAFLALCMIMHELHEHAHFITNWLVCGTGGTRDFNWVKLDECGSGSILSGLAGPTFTFFAIGIGGFLLKSTDLRLVSIGFALVFSNRPLARIVTTLMKGGDELHSAHAFFDKTEFSGIIWIVTSLLVIAIPMVPLYFAYRAFNHKRKNWIFFGLLTFPLFFDVVFLFTIMNGALRFGILNQPGWLGVPYLIYWFLFVMIIVLGYNRQALQHLIVEK